MASKKINLIVSDSKTPLASVKEGTKLEVVGVTLAAPQGSKAKKIAARLCGGTDTCIALVELGEEQAP
jgi:hypothetical protein